MLNSRRYLVLQRCESFEIEKQQSFLIWMQLVLTRKSKLRMNTTKSLHLSMTIDYIALQQWHPACKTHLACSKKLWTKNYQYRNSSSHWCAISKIIVIFKSPEKHMKLCSQGSFDLLWRSIDSEEAKVFLFGEQFWFSFTRWRLKTTQDGKIFSQSNMRLSISHYTFYRAVPCSFSKKREIFWLLLSNISHRT